MGFLGGVRSVGGGGGGGGRGGDCNLDEKVGIDGVVVFVSRLKEAFFSCNVFSLACNAVKCANEALGDCVAPPPLVPS